MTSVIDQLKAQTLSFSDLQYMVGPRVTKKCRWIEYDKLKDFKNIDDLMMLGAVIILMMIEKRGAPKVGHFICLLDHGTHYEHFDSYGITMDEELDLTQEKHLTRIFKTSPKKIVDNHMRLQMFREDINTCGRWVVGRLLTRSIELDAFLKLFNHLKPRSPDEMITVMTLLLTYDK